MRAKLKIAVAAALTLALALTFAPTRADASPAYTAPYTTVRVGIFTFYDDGSVKDRSFPSANLQNVNGLGYGYEIGYFDADRNFVSLGATVTDTDQVTAIMDRNMVYNPGSNSYSEGVGSVTVGCAHLLLDGSYSDYASAKAVADQYSSGFVRYQNGEFLVLVGNYTSAYAAEEASWNIPEHCVVDTGTGYTVALVQTGTNRILFEFDCGTSRNLALRPLGPENGKAQTWHRGYMYYGAFAFLRNTGGNITTVNYVDVEDYVKGVVCYEMSPSWPIEALKAQAITARTYLMANISKHRASGFDVCNTIDCQAYHGTNGADANSDRAVDETRSQYLVYDGELCVTFYAASNGGASENSENVWSEKYEYLRGIEDPYEKDIANTVGNYYWTRTYSPSALGAALRKWGYNSSDVVHIDMTFTEVGNVLSITFTDVYGVRNTVRKERARIVLGFNSQRYTVNGLGPAADHNYFVNEGAALPDGLEGAFAAGGDGGLMELPSDGVYAISGKGEVGLVQAGDVTIEGGVGVNSSGYFVFAGSGDGHNVGMSQWGAYSMAKYHDKTCMDILTFYYSGTEVVTSPRPDPGISSSGPFVGSAQGGDEPSADGDPETNEGSETGGDDPGIDESGGEYEGAVG